ncbi:hypothetical protein GUJ93_ZPchr0010g10304 [Zizania palustris]|uniref:Uncharacterized protein n=1 Tax=Zizania palustris TaxID=103762 RepID=A0A8J5W7A5_ZIZPA|nr:hypothetical protein GUJ93_ZPchr0010g10304 [Zizania palustris]
MTYRPSCHRRPTLAVLLLILNHEDFKVNNPHSCFMEGPDPEPSDGVRAERQERWGWRARSRRRQEASPRARRGGMT